MSGEGVDGKCIGRWIAIHREAVYPTSNLTGVKSI